MNTKLIFEAPNLPGGLIFTTVVAAGEIGPACPRGLRFKESEPTDERPHPFRLAIERFDLGYLLDVITSRRELGATEMRAVEDLNRKLADARNDLQQLSATPNYASEDGLPIPAADWCKGPHPVGWACSYCGPVIEDHVRMKAAGY